MQVEEDGGPEGVEDELGYEAGEGDGGRAGAEAFSPDEEERQAH